ncbi:hypothetical protein [Brevundimonas diminuta]|uniref:Uncharacterized protein n=1 Tax=Brevundimonas diminuta TaxID=293 RepID=A0A1Z3LTH1_BREDI|nr:hypothetical protein [Brevundimonas diminuta]ASD25460.1 hypothetical protein CD943_00215 [Brevundimonas diminuta]
MPQTLARLPSLTWEEMEAIFDELAATNEQRDQASRLLSMTRLAAGSLSPLDLMREIFCIALVLPCGNDRPPKRPDREFHPPRSGG